MSTTGGSQEILWCVLQCFMSLDNAHSRMNSLLIMLHVYYSELDVLALAFVTESVLLVLLSTQSLPNAASLAPLPRLVSGLLFGQELSLIPS